VEYEGGRVGVVGQCSIYTSIFIYIYMYLATGSVQIANGSVRMFNFARSRPPALQNEVGRPKKQGRQEGRGHIDMCSHVGACRHAWEYIDINIYIVYVYI
jgi:hypothetical protein